MDPSSWVEQQLVPTMVAHGCFGDRNKQLVEITKCKVVYKATGEDHLTSTVLFINLELKFERQAPQAYSLFVKVTPEVSIYWNNLIRMFCFITRFICTRMYPFRGGVPKESPGVFTGGDIR